MRESALLIGVFLIANNVALAQDDLKPTAVPSSVSTGAESYVVQLTEFRMKDSSDVELKAADIVKRFERAEEDDDIQIIETIRLSVINGHESMAEIGRQATVTVGVVSGPPGRFQARQTQKQHVGTLVRLIIEPKDGKMFLKLAYEVSRLEGEGTDDSPPDTTTFRIHTALQLELGKMNLAGGSSAAPTSYLMVSVDEQ